MKLYIISTRQDSIAGCEFSKKDAIAKARVEGEGAYVDQIVIANPREALRRVLGNLGGYAESIKTVYTCKRGVPK